MATASATQPITLRLPSKYASPSSTPSTFTPPPVEWLHRTWSVTHSTLEMWRSARNVRITYAPLAPKTSSSSSSSSSSPPAARIDDLVEYEKASGKGGVKSVAGVDTAADADGSWDWRGKGWLFFVGSHWEVLGWGERPLAAGEGGGMERWVVTWFAPTVFTKEGVDVYSDRKEGGSRELVEEVLAALRKTEAKPLAEMCEKDMREVEIKLPWKEK